MKTLAIKTLTLISLFTMLSSCEKEEHALPPADITGKWEWVSSWYIIPLGETNPQTPQNTGLNETIQFNADKSWLLIQNDIHIDSGTYSTGHSSGIPAAGTLKNSYDSIVYRRNGLPGIFAVDYYRIYNDSLQFCNGFAGYIGAGSKYYEKAK